MHPDLDTRAAALTRILKEMGSVVVAYSGGVDSALVLKAATDALGTKALGVIGVSPSLSPEDLAEARVAAAKMGVPLRELATREFENESYASNPLNRCYFCKAELYTRLAELAKAEGYAFIADGFQLDDVGDFRPGQEAGRERNVRSPLREAGFHKADVRALAQALGVHTWNKPAAPCLSSRVAFGVRVSPEVVGTVAAAERAVRRIVPDLRDLRVRHLGAEARIEADADRVADLERAFPALDEALRALGYATVTVSREGYRRGALVPQGAA